MVTFDELDHYVENQTHIITKKTKKIHRGKELTLFAVVMFVSAVGGIIFTNLHLFQATIMEDFLNIKDKAPTIIAQTDSSVINQTSDIKSDTDKHFYLDTKDHLTNQLASNNLVFNTLPPDNRIIIDDLGVDAPIVDLNYYTPEKLEKGDFKSELERGVVRYPNTGNPEGGNMLIFGHTSDYRWNNNDFGQIFRNIPKLTDGQIIKVIWNNHIYHYKVIGKQVVKPKDVAKIYAEYHQEDKNYITIVGCYPVGTANSRIMITAEQLPEDESNSPKPSNQVIQLAKNP